MSSFGPPKPAAASHVVPVGPLWFSVSRPRNVGKKKEVASSHAPGVWPCTEPSAGSAAVLAAGASSEARWVVFSASTSASWARPTASKSGSSGVSRPALNAATRCNNANNSIGSDAGTCRPDSSAGSTRLTSSTVGSPTCGTDHWKDNAAASRWSAATNNGGVTTRVDVPRSTGGSTCVSAAHKRTIFALSSADIHRPSLSSSYTIAAVRSNNPGSASTSRNDSAASLTRTTTPPAGSDRPAHHAAQRRPWWSELNPHPPE